MKQKAFTLIEIFVVLLIFGILITVFSLGVNGDNVDNKDVKMACEVISCWLSGISKMAMLDSKQYRVVIPAGENNKIYLYDGFNFMPKEILNLPYDCKVKSYGASYIDVLFLSSGRAVPGATLLVYKNSAKRYIIISPASSLVTISKTPPSN